MFTLKGVFNCTKKDKCKVIDSSGCGRVKHSKRCDIVTASVDDTSRKANVLFGLSKRIVKVVSSSV